MTPFASAVFCHEQMQQQKTAKMLISSSFRGKVPTPTTPTFLTSAENFPNFCRELS